MPHLKFVRSQVEGEASTLLTSSFSKIPWRLFMLLGENQNDIIEDFLELEQLIKLSNLYSGV